MTDPVTIGGYGAKWLKDSDTKAIGLFKPDPNSNTSLHNCDTGTDYQVPSGKVFIMLSANVINYNEDHTVTLYQHDSADSSGGTQIFEAQSNHSGLNSGIANNINTYITVTAGNYINHSGGMFTCMGVETSA